ncbi:class I SAM-dependent methyltransferase [Thermovenabulum gondwanense]|uniref:Tellurite methyltransferase n=1 Tax=Thermovenabulum gondwanense TaxID=520767 RepID=A0A162M5C1_9FIRM|nr:class I SAM-dependent methyltransferase [Thermovenabulum gondwanense]KYO64108.1 Tellurite methyltransferase [Thermovenabulum gondwanense]
MDPTIKYYDENAKAFFENTKDADMKEVYELFLKYLPPGAKILDLGCGSGRDTRYFSQKGYDVTAVDGSIEMVKLSTQFTGRKTLHLTFDEINFNEEFDGVWACASLLHVPRSKIVCVINKIYSALKKGRIFYSSFKYGNGEEIRNGRFFNNYDEKSFNELLKNHPYFTLLEMKVTGDVRKGRENEKWLNVVLRKE